MERLTEKQEAILPERARVEYATWKVGGGSDGLRYLCIELARALEQVAAAELMATALLSVAYHEELSGDECSVCKRYRDTALAAYKAACDD